MCVQYFDMCVRYMVICVQYFDMCVRYLKIFVGDKMKYDVLCAINIVMFGDKMK